MVAPGVVAEPFRVVLTDELAVKNRQRLKQCVVDALEEGRRTIVVDASACGYIDSSGLGVLVSINKKCRDVGGTLTIVGLNDDMRAFLEYVYLDTILTLAPVTPT